MNLYTVHTVSLRMDRSVRTNRILNCVKQLVAKVWHSWSCTSYKDLDPHLMFKILWSVHINLTLNKDNCIRIWCAFNFLWQNIYWYSTLRNKNKISKPERISIAYGYNEIRNLLPYNCEVVHFRPIDKMMWHSMSSMRNTTALEGISWSQNCPSSSSLHQLLFTERQNLENFKIHV